MTTTTIIHVRFAPDGSVSDIGERPEGVTAERWFTSLSEKFGAQFKALAGGRGVFRVDPESVQTLKASV